MNTLSFKDGKTGEIYRRITKPAARKAFLSGARVGFIACNMNPFFVGNYPMYNTSRADRAQYYADANDDIAAANDFNNLCNSFIYYNCNADTGKYISFYLIEKVVKQ